MIANGTDDENAALWRRIASTRLDMLEEAVQVCRAMFAGDDVTDLRAVDDRKLSNALAELRPSFDFILLDCPPAVGLLTVNALTAADGVLAMTSDGRITLWNPAAKTEMQSI